MKKKLLILVIVQLMYNCIYGQQNQIIIDGGLKLNNVYKPPMPNSNYILGYSISISYNYFLGESIFLSSGLMLNEKGYEVKTKIYTDEMLYKVNSYYIDLPLKINILPTKSKKISIGIGSYIGYGIKGQISNTFMGKTESKNIKWGNKGGDYDNTPDHKRLDLGLSANISYHYQRLIASIEYEIGLVDMVPSGIGGGERNKSFRISLGYVIIK